MTEQAVESAEAFIERKTRQWEEERRRQVGPKTKDIGRQARDLWLREAWTFLPQHNYAEKVLSVERLLHVATSGPRSIVGGATAGDVEYRFGYWVVGKIGRAAGKWTWGQFSPHIPAADLERLLAKARAEGTILP